MFSTMGPIGEAPPVKAVPTLRSSFKEKSDSIQKEMCSVTFENTTQETIRRNEKRSTTIRKPTKTNELVSKDSTDLNNEKPKEATRAIKRSLSVGSIEHPNVTQRSVKFAFPQNPKIETLKEDEKYNAKSEPISEQTNDDLQLEKKTTYLSSNATSIILVLIFIAFAQLFL